MSTPRDTALLEGYRRLVRPVLFSLGGGDAETAHEATLRALGLLGRARPLHPALAAALASPDSPVEVAGLRFRNRVGLAAGVDKDGVALPAWPLLGLGHVELGTVTAHAQPGNPRPRMLRAVASEGIVNRMGFNNQGAAALAQRLREARAAHGRLDCVVGVSLGKTKATPVQEAVEDYLASLAALDGLADYVAVNVSSPNTPGLRGLQGAGPLAELLRAVVGRAGELARARGARPAPVLVKLAPDLDDRGLDEALEVALSSGAAGIIATNTTLSREGLAPADAGLAAEAGGLSGAPLTVRARQVVRHVAERTPLPVIGVGGVMTPDDGLALLDAGASLVQVYSGLVYAGPALVTGLNQAVAARA